MDMLLSDHLKLMLKHYGIEMFERAVDRLVSEYRGEMHVVHTNERNGYPMRTFTLTNAEFDHIMAEVRADQKIAAIKLFRKITDCSLIDAKDAIEGPEFKMLRFDQRYPSRDRCG